MIDFETARAVYIASKGLAPTYMQSMFHSKSESCNRTLTPALTLQFNYAKPLKGSAAFPIDELLSGIG